MAITLLQTNVTAGTTGTGATTLSAGISTVTAGSLLTIAVAVVTNNSGPVISISDSGGQTWIAGAKQAFLNNNYGYVQQFYIQNSEPITSVTVNSTVTAAIASSFFEASGLLTSGTVLDVVSGANGTTTTPSVSGGTTLVANELAVGFVGVGVVADSGDYSQWTTAPSANWNGLGITTFWPSGAGGSSIGQVFLVGYYDIMSAEAVLTLAGTFYTTGSNLWGASLMSFLSSTPPAPGQNGLMVALI